MKIGPCWWCGVILSVSVSRVFAASADSLLAETIVHPKGWTQMCISSPAVPPELPIPVYPLRQVRDIVLSDDRKAALLKHRAEIMPALGRLLDGIDPAQTVTAPPPKLRKDNTAGNTVQDSGVSPKELSSLLLQIVEETRALEVLPNLLALEDRLHTALERADQDPKAPAAHVASDAPEVPLDEAKGATERAKQQAHARIQQRELLSLMVEMLREQKFPPLLQSRLEQSFARVRKHVSDLPDKYAPGVPYSARNRAEVRALVERFVRTVPKSQWIPVQT